MKDSLYIKAEQLLNRYMEEHKMKTSFERFAILRTICSMPQPVTSKEVTEQVKAQNISRATVYNTLKLLCLAQILYKIGSGIGAGSSYYELRLGKSNRMRIICSRCGRVSEVKDKTTETQLLGKRYPNFNMHNFSVYIYGECKLCRKNKK